MQTPRLETTRQQPKAQRPEWPLPTALILLSLVPFIGGIARLLDISNPATITPENARFVNSPFPVVLHIIGALPFSILGAFQFMTSFRQRRPAWHRNVGRWLLVSGLITAISGLWMTLFYPIPANLQGPILYVSRLVVSTAMAVFIWLAWNTVRQKNVAAHRAWMTRAYALGQGAGTQVLVLLPYMLLIGQPDQFARDILMSAAWGINLVVAEWTLRHTKRR